MQRAIFHFAHLTYAFPAMQHGISFPIPLKSLSRLHVCRFCKNRNIRHVPVWKCKILLSLYTFSIISAAASALSAQILTLFSETATSIISYCFMVASPLPYRSMPLSRTHSFVLKSAPTKWSASKIYWLSFQFSSTIRSASARLSAFNGDGHL